MQDEIEIINTAKQDYFKHKGIYTNPYPTNSDQFNAYEREWMQSLKIDKGEITLISEKIKTSNPAQTSNPKIEINLYARRKG